MESSSGSVRQHLNRFAFATILAGVGLLALAWPASAEIVYTAVDIHVKPTSSYSLDLNNDGVTDLTIKADYFKSVVNGRVTCQGSFVSETPANGSAAETGTGYGPLVLSRGDPIGPSQGYYSGQGDLAYWKRGWFCRNGVFGYWWNISGGYLGLMFQINGETHYGWAKLSVHGK